MFLFSRSGFSVLGVKTLCWLCRSWQVLFWKKLPQLCLSDFTWLEFKLQFAVVTCQITVLNRCRRGIKTVTVQKNGNKLICEALLIMEMLLLLLLQNNMSRLMLFNQTAGTLREICVLYCFSVDAGLFNITGKSHQMLCWNVWLHNLINDQDSAFFFSTHSKTNNQ